MPCAKPPSNSPARRLLPSMKQPYRLIASSDRNQPQRTYVATKRTSASGRLEPIRVGLQLDISCFNDLNLQSAPSLSPRPAPDSRLHVDDG